MNKNGRLRVNLVDLLGQLAEDHPGGGVLLLDVAELLGVHHVEERRHLVADNLHQGLLMQNRLA